MPSFVCESLPLDLDEIQRHTRHHFVMPDAVPEPDRVRVAVPAGDDVHCRVLHFG